MAAPGPELTIGACCVVTVRRRGAPDIQAGSQLFAQWSNLLGFGSVPAEAAKGGSPEAVAQATPRVHLLYRPGHYDIMYPHGTAAPAAQQPQVRGGPAASGATGGGSGLDDVAVSRSLAATLDAIRDGSVTAGGGVSQGFA